MLNTRKLTARRCTPRPIAVKLGIIHHTGSRNDLSNYLASPLDKAVSVHFHINRQGEIAQYSNLIGLKPNDGWAKQAWHAGVSKWKLAGKEPLIGLNKHAIGIELAGDGNRWEYTEEQYLALGELVMSIARAFPQLRSPDTWIGHQHSTPPSGWYPSKLYSQTSLEIVSNRHYYNTHRGRKPDPGELFNWGRFYGLLESEDQVKY